MPRRRSATIVTIAVAGSVLTYLLLSAFLNQITAPDRVVLEPSFATRVNLRSFDASSRSAQLDVTVDPRLNVRKPYLLAVPDSLAEPLLIHPSDMGAHNFLWAIHELRTKVPTKVASPPDWTPADRPVKAHFELTLPGNPVLFPFDSYALIAYVWTPGTYRTTSGYLVVNVDFEITLGSTTPAIEIRLLTRNELRRFLTSGLSAEFRDSVTGMTDVDLADNLTGEFSAVQWNRHNGLAVELRRPRSLRWFAVSFLVLAFAWTVRLGFLDFSQAWKEGVGLAGALIGVRGALVEHAPTFPCAADYGFLLGMLALGAVLVVKWRAAADQMPRSVRREGKR